MTTLLRHELGDVLRQTRQRQGRTLRQVSSQARVSLGYLSEVERGQKEASSELLASICTALEVPLGSVLREVSDRLGVLEGAVRAERAGELVGTVGSLERIERIERADGVDVVAAA